MAKAMATDDNAARHGTRPREPGMIRTRGPSEPVTPDATFREAGRSPERGGSRARVSVDFSVKFSVLNSIEAKGSVASAPDLCE
ncbi:hypothetical protein SUDANB58_05700 [Streptomyces sp. enrichment culture]